MLEFDGLYTRKLIVSKIRTTFYVFLKQFITIFILANTIGVIYYLIDFALVNDNIDGLIC